MDKHSLFNKIQRLTDQVPPNGGFLVQLKNNGEWADLIVYCKSHESWNRYWFYRYGNQVSTDWRLGHLYQEEIKEDLRSIILEPPRRFKVKEDHFKILDEKALAQWESNIQKHNKLEQLK